MKYRNNWAFPDADEFMMNEITADGTYQESHLFAAMQYVTERSLAVDCGSHAGTWAKLMSALFEHVIAVEPSADTFEALAVNMATFGCENVALRNIALGDKAGTVSMMLDGREAARKNTGARYVVAGSDVRCETLDSWDLPALGFLKIDVEGSELLVLQGAKNTLTQCQPIVLFEDKGFGTRFGQKRDAPQTFLTSIGYRELALTGCDRIWGPTS